MSSWPRWCAARSSTSSRGPRPRPCTPRPGSRPPRWCARPRTPPGQRPQQVESRYGDPALLDRSEEHTSELQSRGHLVCRLLLEKKKTLVNEDIIPKQERDKYLH